MSPSAIYQIEASLGYKRPLSQKKKKISKQEQNPQVSGRNPSGFQRAVQNARDFEGCEPEAHGVDF